MTNQVFSVVGNDGVFFWLVAFSSFIFILPFIYNLCYFQLFSSFWQIFLSPRFWIKWDISGYTVTVHHLVTNSQHAFLCSLQVLRQGMKCNRFLPTLSRILIPLVLLCKSSTCSFCRSIDCWTSNPCIGCEKWDWDHLKDFSLDA